MILKKIFSFATLTLLVALSLSSIAAWYSIQGLIAIFSAAVVPITIMGGSLEVAKVVTTVWLHRYWKRAKWQMKLYMVPALVSLALLTSMGIFGFLSKAHSDQALVSGDVAAKIAVYDQKIDTAKQTIDADRKALSQMDAQVDQLLGRTTDDKGANRAVAVRKQQATERGRLNKEIEDAQATITKVNEDAAPTRAEVRKVDAEVGPIKYIAALIYGDNPSGELLERAVRWVIILIVFVFDPLALTLVLAAQSSYEWLEEDENKTEKPENPYVPGSIFPVFDVQAPMPEKEPEEVETDVDDTVPADAIEMDDRLGEELPEEHPPSPIEDVIELEPNEDGPAEPDSAEGTPEVRLRLPANIETEGVTLHQTDGDYIQFEGKSVSKQALRGMHPEIFAARPDATQINTNFGTSFPIFAKKGDIFVRVDLLPNRVYKFDSTKWIEINKEQTDSYLYDQEYLDYLITMIEKGEYDVDLLSENERIELEQFLQRKNS